MKKILLCILAIAALAGCKTTEANYRAAYDKAIAGRDSATALENTIYGANRRAMDASEIAVDGDTVEIRRHFVRVTEGGGAVRENLKGYNVVAQGFKQVFNAKSMRERAVDGGFPGAFVVETGEPYYYVVLSSHYTLPEAAKVLKESKKFYPKAFILQAASF